MQGAPSTATQRKRRIALRHAHDYFHQSRDHHVRADTTDAEILRLLQTPAESANVVAWWMTREARPMAASTADGYRGTLAGLLDLHGLQQGMGAPAARGVITGQRRRAPKRARPRGFKPVVTFEQLLVLRTALLGAGTLDEEAMWCAILVMYLFGLRASEAVPTRDTEHHLLREDVIMPGDHGQAELILQQYTRKQHQTADITGARWLRVFPNTNAGDALNPFRDLLHYIERRDGDHPDWHNLTQLFLGASYAGVGNALARILPETGATTHCLRVTMATQLSHRGMPEDSIKARGFWASDAFRLYTRERADHERRLQRALTDR